MTDTPTTPQAQPLTAHTADLDAGREWMRRAWQELNAIRARDGAPQGVSHEWWDTLTESLGSLLADDRAPWMTGAARKLVAPYETERDAARAETEAVRRERDALLTDRDLWKEQHDALATLAADLVEGLNWYRLTVATGDRTALVRDGGKLADALISRARARAREKEKGNA